MRLYQRFVNLSNLVLINFISCSWFAIFYLITTDILGPFNAPFAFSQVGYVPGAILYVVSTYRLFFVYLCIVDVDSISGAQWVL